MLWKEQPGLHRGYLVDVVTAVMMAAVLLLGGRERTVAPVWRTLNDNGGPELWGTVFAGVATLLILATFLSGRAMMFALWASAVPYALVGWWFLSVALIEPTASFIGVVYSFRAAATHMFRAEAYRVGARATST